MTTIECRQCGRPIELVRHARTGKRLPLDPDPTPAGNVLVISTDTQSYLYGGAEGTCVVLGAVSAQASRDAGEPLRIHHRATCPKEQGS